MRIPHSQLFRTISQQNVTNKKELYRLQEQVASGKKYTKVSDDPFTYASIFGLNQELTNHDNDVSKISMSLSLMTTVENVSDELSDIFDKVKTLILNGNNTDNQTAMNQELISLQDRIKQLGNTKLGEKYIFAGNDTKTRPFQDDYSYVGSINTSSIDVFGNDVPININGAEMFQGMFQHIEDVKADLGSESITRHLDKNLEMFNKSVGNQMKYAGKMNHLESDQKNITRMQKTITDMISSLEEVDMIEVIAKLKDQETIYEAGLKTSSMLMNTTLLDFI